MRLFALAALALALGCSGCHPSPPPVNPPPSTMGDAMPAPFEGGVATCLDVCRNGQRLGCRFAADTPAGATCATVCANNQSVGIAPWDLDCRARAPNCVAVDKCR